MESRFAWLALLPLLLFANSIVARKDPGEYWTRVMEDQPMPEAIQDLVHLDLSPSHLTKNTNCHTPQQATKKLDQLVKDFQPIPRDLTFEDDGKLFAKDFVPTPDVTIYRNSYEGKLFVKEIVPTPDLTIYHDNAEEDKSFVKEFVPTPDVTIYHDSSRSKEEKPLFKGFGLTPDVVIYHDSSVGEKLFAKDFAPDITIYHDSSEEEKSFVKESVLTQDVTIYHDRPFVKRFAATPDATISHE